MMYGVRKQFDEELWKRNHVPAVKKFVEFARNVLHRAVVEHPNKFAVDIIAVDGLDEWELEHREIKNWIGRDFPYPDVNIPERKKYLEKGDKHYVIFSPDWSRMGIVDKSVVKTYIEGHKPVPNPNRLGDDLYVYQVPKYEFRWYDV